MRVLYAAAEIFPLLKTGGLADVTGSLPPALRRLGIDVRLLLPGVPEIRDGARATEAIGRLDSPFGPATIRLGAVGEVPCYVIDAPALYERAGNPYLGPDGRDWPDNHRRFGLLGWAAAHAADAGLGDWRPAIVHGHDWHTGLAPAYLAAMDRPARSVFTIHNLAFQGLFPAPLFDSLALPPTFFAVEGVEFFGQVSFLKAALQFADRITTVSPSYAQEITEAEHGAGLDGLLRRRRADLGGILNGVDEAIWDPTTDPYLPHHFGAGDTAGKAAAKAALQTEMGLQQRSASPLFGAVTRLTHQKGSDLLIATLADLVTEGGQFALLGSGDSELERDIRAAADAHPGSIAVRIGYDEGLAHRIIGGADSILVPSRFEPCGLTQLYGLRYGTLPLVRRTGGLADTVVDANDATLADGTATGFAFDAPEATHLADAIRRAVATFRERDRWSVMRHRAMTRGFGWRQAAEAYQTLYRNLIA